MASPPKWIADELHTFLGHACSARVLDALAVTIAAAFPVEAVADAIARIAIVRIDMAIAAQTHPSSASVANDIGSASVRELRSVIAGPGTEAENAIAELGGAWMALQRAGVPWAESDGHLMNTEERIAWLGRQMPIANINRMRACLERARLAIREVFAAHESGDIEDSHYPDEDDRGDRDCPEDDTCTCRGRATFLKLQHALEAIEGKREP
jgi:hypothetical protein